ncbi:hypothetical protein NUSPORA_02343 [Nucleospora cyclopteri]
MKHKATLSQIIIFPFFSRKYEAEKYTNRFSAYFKTLNVKNCLLFCYMSISFVHPIGLEVQSPGDRYCTY